MTLKRMDNVGVVVDDLAAAVAFFKELGLELEGEAHVEGRSVDRLIGLDGVLSDIAMMRTPDGHGRVELTKFRRPTADRAEPNNAPPNTLGIRRIMFAVEDIDDVVARLRAHGAELVGELVQYENGSVMSVALRASSSRSPRRSADDSGTVESEEATEQLIERLNCRGHASGGWASAAADCLSRQRLRRSSRLTSRNGCSLFRAHR